MASVRSGSHQAPGQARDQHAGERLLLMASDFADHD
jgi:hypothetical protein